MPRSRMMGAGLASSTRIGSRSNVRQVQGGDKLQGLPGITNKRVGAVRAINIKSYGENRNVVFCINQLGGVGAVSGGNGSRMFGTTSDGVKGCIKGPYGCEQVVREAYLEAYGREPDASGLRTYCLAMTRRRWSKADVIADLKKNGDSFDTDKDGIVDNQDAFPNDPTETQDTDKDGVGDNADAFPNDSTKTKPFSVTDYPLTKFYFEQVWASKSGPDGVLDINTMPIAPEDLPPEARNTTTGELLTIFDLYDKNKDGRITQEEYINEVLKNFVDYVKNTPVNVLDYLDKNNDGIVSKAELFEYLLAKVEGGSASAELIFSILDNNGNDTIEGEELIDIASFIIQDTEGDRVLMGSTLPEGTELYIPSAAGDDGVIKGISEEEGWRTARELERID